MNSFFFVYLCCHGSAKVLLRQLMTLSYFSPLLGPAEAVAREQGVAPDAHSNILFLALPLEIPWSDVAIHIVNCQVSANQLCLVASPVHLKEAMRRRDQPCIVIATDCSMTL